jgi:predicted GIY-YIG superfamily endonuclease
MTDEPGTIYLLHFDRPFGHAKHYLGWARNLDARLAHHDAGTGANILRHALKAGITWTLVRTWEQATRTEERRLKKHSSTRYCPTCQGERYTERGKSSVGTVGASKAAS